MAGGDSGKGASRSLYALLARFAVRGAPSPEASLGGSGEHAMHAASKRARFLPKRGVYIIVGPSLIGTEPQGGLRRPRVPSVPAMRVYDLPRYDFDLPGVAFLRRVRVVGRSFRMRV